MKNSINCSLLGCGSYGKVHARAFKSDERVNFVSLWSPTRSRREENARLFGCRSAETWEEIVNDPSVDCISIATPDFTHTEYAVAALNAGKHVLLEKPMAMTTRDCKKIIEAKDSSGKKLMINYHNRWYPAFIAGRDAISSGKIGKPVCGNFVLSDTIAWVEDNMKWADRSGPEWFLMTHTADLAFWMLGETPVEVFAMAEQGVLKRKGFPTRDLVKATIRMTGGAIIHFESSWILARNWRHPVNDMWVSVQGESGRIDIQADYENITITSDTYQTPFVLQELTEMVPIQDFISCILEDGKVAVTAEESLLATQAVEAVVKSYRENRVVRIDEIE